MTSPAIDAGEIGSVDAVLLSHDQHADNLDHAGRAYALAAERVFTTAAGAGRLGGRCIGLRPWDETAIDHGNASLAIVATPARHGPAGIEPLSGDVIGFVVRSADACIYITGDTVWFDGVAEVARRFDPDIVILFAGAARTRGPFYLTMDTNDAIETAHACPRAAIVPVHCEGWEHFSQNRQDLELSFNALGIGSRLRMIEPGVRISVEIAPRSGRTAEPGDPA